MSDLIDRIISIPAPFNMIVLIVLFGAMASVLGSFAKQIRKYFCHRQEMELKRELVERGLSVDEIERIVRAQPANGPTQESDT